MANVASIVFFVGVRAGGRGSQTIGPGDSLSSPISELYLFYSFLA